MRGNSKNIELLLKHSLATDGSWSEQRETNAFLAIAEINYAGVEQNFFSEIGSMNGKQVRPWPDAPARIPPLALGESGI